MTTSPIADFKPTSISGSTSPSESKASGYTGFKDKLGELVKSRNGMRNINLLLNFHLTKSLINWNLSKFSRVSENHGSLLP